MISKKIIGASMIFISLCSALVFGRPKKNGIKIDSRGLKIPYEVLKKTDGGIEVRKGGFGSDACAYPGDNSKFYLITDRGPHIVHFSSEGKELERISPYGMTTNGRKIPAVLSRRRANRGMEGLAKTPDEKFLVGIMQSTLHNPSKKEIVNNRLIRIVKFELATGKTWQYLYQQNKETDSCCGITALSNDEFIVIERDGNFAGEKEAHKYLYKINLKDASDVNGDMTSGYGMIIDGKTLEQCTQKEVLDAGIKFAKKELITDLVTEIGYGHDKLEGLWLLDEHTICVANDNDFALIEKDNKLNQKILPGTNNPEDDVVYSVKF